MSKNGNLIVTYYEGNPDMWNTKPPLMIWAQVFFIKTIGLNELSVRLPSAIAAFLTCMALLWFSVKHLNSFWFGFIAVLVLMTSQGYVSMHGSRSGDYDALLTLFTTLYCLTYFVYLEKGQLKHLYLTFVFLALGILTKGVAAALFLPALFVFTLVKKKMLPVLANKHTYIGLLIPIVLVGAYYLLRESQNPGYLQAVFENELGGRYTTPKEGHYGKLYYYFNNIVDARFTHWYLLLPCGLALGLLNKNKKISSITLYSALLIITFHWVINSAATKLAWYDIPMYPFFAILVAVFVHYIFTLLVSWKKLEEKLTFNIIPSIFLFLLFAAPFGETWDNTYWPFEEEEHKDGYALGYVLKDAFDNRRNLDGYNILHVGANPHWLFYTRMLQEKNQNLSFKKYKNLEAGDLIIMSQDSVRMYVDTNYTVNRLEAIPPVYLYEITGIVEYPSDSIPFAIDQEKSE